MTEKLNEQIKTLKTFYSRDNYYYMRRRIPKGNGKKTLGWIMENDSKSLIKENINILTLKEELK